MLVITMIMRPIMIMTMIVLILADYNRRNIGK